MLSWAGAGLMLAALVQMLVFRGHPFAPGMPWATAPSAHATMAGGLASLLTVPRAGLRSASGPVTRVVLDRGACDLDRRRGWTGLRHIASIKLHVGGAPCLAGRSLARALLAWSFGIALRRVSGVTGSVMFATATGLATGDWYLTSAQPWLDPWRATVQAAGAGAAEPWLDRG